MSEKRDEVEKIVNEIYCDLDLDGQEDWDRVSEILYRAFTKPAPVQSAEDIFHYIRPYQRPDGKSKPAPCAQECIDAIASAFAAQRQAGREEMLDAVTESLDSSYAKGVADTDARYAAVVEAARFLVSGYLGPCRYGDIDSDTHDLHKALRDLDEARGGK